MFLSPARFCLVVGAKSALFLRGLMPYFLEDLCPISGRLCLASRWIYLVSRRMYVLFLGGLVPLPLK